MRGSVEFSGFVGVVGTRLWLAQAPQVCMQNEPVHVTLYYRNTRSSCPRTRPPTGPEVRNEF